MVIRGDVVATVSMRLRGLTRTKNPHGGGGDARVID